MPRVIGLIFIALLAALAVAAVTSGRRQRPGTYRPKPRWADLFEEITGRAAPRPAAPPSGLVHIVKRSELAGVRDAFSSAPIDPGAALARCGKCLSLYHETSRAALERENHGRCVVCSSTDLGRVSLVDDD